MCSLPSEESLSFAMNTTFWPQKTTYILNNPQRQKGHTKRNNAYRNLLQEEKDLRSTPVIGRSPSVAPQVACVTNVSVQFQSKERGTRVKDRAKNQLL